MTRRDANYEVGYGRPPKRTQFQRGQSGNPAGRAKGRKTASAVVAEALRETVTVTVNGRRRTMTKLEAGAVQLANAAASGDRNAIKLALEVASMHDASLAAELDVAGRSSLEARGKADAIVLEALRRRAAAASDDHG